jgi:hypothetical protein
MANVDPTALAIVSGSDTATQRHVGPEYHIEAKNPNRCGSDRRSPVVCIVM